MLLFLHGYAQTIVNTTPLKLNKLNIMIKTNSSYVICCHKIFVSLGTGPRPAGLFLLTSNVVAKRPTNIYRTMTPLLINKINADKITGIRNPSWHLLDCSDPTAFKYFLQNNTLEAFQLSAREIYLEIEIKECDNYDWI